MNFLNEKKQALSKLDKSRKGDLDEHILNLVKLINNHPDYYTTSSCSGRIMFIKPSKIKHEAEWLFSSHEPIKLNDLPLNKLPEETIWFRVEPPILHICAKDLDSAYYLLKKANELGFRRSALLSFKKRIIVEILFLEKMDVPFSKDIELSDEYLQLLIKEANNKEFDEWMLNLIKRNGTTKY